jgi:hypothetical protein
MQKTNQYITALLILLTVCGISGCSKTPAPDAQQQPADGSSAASMAPESSELTLTVGFIFGDTQKIPNPDEALIKKHVRETDWHNAQQRPLVHLARVDASGATFVKLQGTLGTPNVDGAFRAIVIGIDGNRTTLGAESPPLESPDAAIELLLLLRNDPQKLRTLAAQWEGAEVRQ